MSNTLKEYHRLRQAGYSPAFSYRYASGCGCDSDCSKSCDCDCHKMEKESAQKTAGEKCSSCGEESCGCVGCDCKVCSSRKESSFQKETNYVGHNGQDMTWMPLPMPLPMWMPPPSPNMSGRLIGRPSGSLPSGSLPDVIINQHGGLPPTSPTAETHLMPQDIYQNGASRVVNPIRGAIGAGDIAGDAGATDAALAAGDVAATEAAGGALDATGVGLPVGLALNAAGLAMATDPYGTRQVFHGLGNMFGGGNGNPGQLPLNALPDPRMYVPTGQPAAISFKNASIPRHSHEAMMIESNPITSPFALPEEALGHMMHEHAGPVEIEMQGKLPQDADISKVIKEMMGEVDELLGPDKKQKEPKKESSMNFALEQYHNLRTAGYSPEESDLIVRVASNTILASDIVAMQKTAAMQKQADIDFFRDAGGFLDSGINNGLNFLGQVPGAVGQAAYGAGKGFGMGQNAVSGAMNAFPGLMSAGGGAIESGGNAAMNAVRGVGNAGANAARGFVNAVPGAIGGAGAVTEATARGMGNAAQTGLRDLQHAGQGALNDLFGFGNQVGNAGANAAQTGLRDLQHAGQGALNDLFGFGGQAAYGAGKGVGMGQNAVTQGVNDVKGLSNAAGNAASSGANAIWRDIQHAGAPFARGYRSTQHPKYNENNDNEADPLDRLRDLADRYHGAYWQ
jgi:hypothetical protein